MGNIMSFKTSKTEDWFTVSSFKDQENIDLRSRITQGAGNPRHSNPPEQSPVSVEDVNIERGKRKASVDAGPPGKKTKSSVSSHKSEPKSTPWTNCHSRSGKRKANDDGNTQRKRACCGDRPTSTKPILKVKEQMSEDEKIYSSTGKTSRADFVDTYRELEAIGAGGFGCVFSGIRKADGLPVAIKHIPSDKVLRRPMTCNGKIYNVCLEVAFMMKTSGQPGSAVISLLDWYDLKEELILVMEKPDKAMDLRTYLEAHGGFLTDVEAKMILKQLVDAAIDIHSKGIFHRDIKLQNVLIRDGSNGPRIWIIDFGCGTFSTRKPYHSFRGTFMYAPPEWCESRTYWAQPTTVWQLGALFYSLLRGHGRFTTGAFMNKKININKALSTEVKILLQMCLAINPEDRCTLEELQLILARLQQSNPPCKGTSEAGKSFR